MRNEIKTPDRKLKIRLENLRPKFIQKNFVAFQFRFEQQDVQIFSGMDLKFVF